jgi:hypothetical protein
MSTLLEGHTQEPAVLRHELLPNRAAAAPGSQWLALGVVAIAIGLATAALLGPLATGAIDYRITETLRNQTIGLDAVLLFLVSPLALLAALLVVRRHVAGPVLALGAGAYTSYMYVQYILGPDYAHMRGNNERLFPLALFLFGAGWAVALTAWHLIDTERLPRSRKRERLIGQVILPVLALAAFGRYVPSLTDWMSSSPQDKNYLAGPSFSWAIAMLDLGVFLPATVATRVGLVRGTRWAQKALYTVVGWFGLVGPAVAAMAITMYVNDDPIASGGNTIFMSVLGLAFLTLAVFVYWPLFRGRAGSPVAEEEVGP